MFDLGPSKLGITLGDPSGVGPELVAELIAKLGPDGWSQIQVFADRSILERAYIQRTGERLPDSVPVLDRGRLSPDQAVPGQPSMAGAAAQIGYLEAAVKAAKAGDIGGIVTAPIAKAHCRRQGFEFHGQTEFFANRFGVDDVVMMFSGSKLRVALVTTHIPLSSVPQSLTKENILKVTTMAGRAMVSDFGVEHPRIGILGLNPHAGEDGHIGSEEADTIEPAVELARKELQLFATVSGPLVPDVAFRTAHNLGLFDLLIAMYHDQALIPLKLVDFELAVNVTIGLPVVRTSPDHGVAYDIAGTGRVRHDSFLEAFDLAKTMVLRRRSQG